MAIKQTLNKSTFDPWPSQDIGRVTERDAFLNDKSPLQEV